MGGNKYLAFFGLLVISMLMLTSGCMQYVQPDGTGSEPSEEKSEIVSKPITSAQQDTPAEEEEKDAPAEQTEETDDSTREMDLEIKREEVVTTTVTPVTPAKKEADTCRCSFTWDPVCGIDAKTYINECLFVCAGNSKELLASGSQCPKKGGTIKIYTDDVKIDYESDKSNGAYCWRQMYRNEGLRRCDNLITNGRINIEPAPRKGNWLDEDNLVFDKFGRKESYSIELEVGEKKTNEEYAISYQPLFEKGEYMFSFWARQDIVAGNDWKVRLILRDWNSDSGMPDGVGNCYEMSTEIDAQDVYIEELPNKWKHYHYVFDVPLNEVQWQKAKRYSSSCEYAWDKFPHGYRIEVEGPSFGRAWFDDFSLIKTS